MSQQGMSAEAPGSGLPRACKFCGAPLLLCTRKRGGKVVKYAAINHKTGCEPAERFNYDEKCYEIDLIYPGVVHGGYV